MSSLKRKIQRQGLCVFCGRPGLTKEHIWSDWLKRYIPIVASHRMSAIRMQGDLAPGGKVILQPHLSREKQGGVSRQHLRRVCGHCNNGWMKGIVDAARPTVVRILKKEQLEIQPAEAAALSGWIAIACIMAEYLDDRTRAIPAEERVALMKARATSSDWIISIGQYEGQEWSPASYKHFGAIFKTSPGPGGLPEPPLHYLHIATYTLGPLAVQAISTNHAAILADASRRWIASDMIQLFPAAPRSFKWPPHRILRDGMVDMIIDGPVGDFLGGNVPTRRGL
ncbi:MAG: hypothetical protein EPO10_13315 [Reyranella sp.]|uniref:hypothetical protein n=1 Tax=Reyranella sp. TaxID=1929291 RepID=UPI0011FD0D24|nr:hypothetical protein [Reyranella sp.]TAJ96984.1 MAG: hypothetical protein EPO41_04645 [Reyranella sp.]TBR28380.1 MAG: hypothetical protein EPO10_13315 [Reyranella sp.]